MTLDKQIDIQKRIQAYINGNLSQQQIDELWIEFLKDPDWYDYFITELHLIALGKKLFD